MPRAKTGRKTPTSSVEQKEIPEADIEEMEAPKHDPSMPEMPDVGNPENKVLFGEEMIEIKPMKLIYQRNRTAVFYHALEIYPLPDILAMSVNPKTGVSPFGDKRDGDQALFEWLVAATDNEELVKKYYNYIDSDTVYQILEIFKRVNRIDEREKKIKNVVTPRGEG